MGILENLRPDFVKIRTAVPEDAAAMLEIYAPFILNSTASFETEVPSLEEFTEKITESMQTYPCVVFEYGGKVVGYTIARKFSPGATYMYDAKISLYVLAEYQDIKIEQSLYGSILEVLKGQGFYNAYSYIALPSERGLALHRSLKFEMVGTARRMCYKFNKWYDVAVLFKSLVDSTLPPKEITKMCDMNAQFVNRVYFGAVKELFNK
ncbi:MAG: N-acetyltransferase [Clostridiales bacterium]|nr:N-acetyltransferase [Clostridiales bacterium]